VLHQLLLTLSGQVQTLRCSERSWYQIVLEHCTLTMLGMRRQFWSTTPLTSVSYASSRVSTSSSTCNRATLDIIWKGATITFMYLRCRVSYLDHGIYLQHKIHAWPG
jgi:hypothetical protein